MGDHELEAEVGVPGLARVEAERVVAGDLELEVHADVDDDAGGPQALGVEHAHPVGGVVEVAEVVHQPLGVERPALAVAADPAHQPLPAVEQLAAVGGLRDLEVVAGHALVEDGRDLAPGGEVVDAVGDRPPHPARAGEVLGRAGVVDAAVVGRGEHALDPADRLGDVEVDPGHLLDRAVGEVLHPRPERLAAVDLAGLVGLEVVDRLARGGSREDPVGRHRHVVGEPLELLPAPGVGLLEVDGGAEEVARLERVVVAPDGVPLPGVGEHLALEEAGHLLQRLVGGRRVAGQVVTEGGYVAARGELAEDVAALAGAAGPRADLGDHLAVLPGGADAPGRGLLRQGGAVAREGVGEGLQPRRDGCPVGLGPGRHQVEDLPGAVERALEDVELRAAQTGVGDLDVEADPLEERVAGDLLPHVHGSGGAHVGERAAGQLLPGREAVGGPVRQPVLVAVDADERRGDRVEGSVVLDESVGDLIDASGCHPDDPRRTRWGTPRDIPARRPRTPR